MLAHDPVLTLARAPKPKDTVTIRGVSLPLAELVDRSYFRPERIESLRRDLQAAQPFPHLVLKDLFHPRLLELATEEFESIPWIEVKSRNESTRRSPLCPPLGPASQLYFDTVHSGWFTEWLSAVTQVPYLLPDPKLSGGGAHESRPGASFAVHRDFKLHRMLGLRNEMVFITYLNKGWQPEWGGMLELWDARRERCVTQVLPAFGHTLLMPHSAVSFHGHPEPMQPPDGRPRRSLAAYYYTSPDAGKVRDDQASSMFMNERRFDRLFRFAQMVTPPVLFTAAWKLSSVPGRLKKKLLGSR
jgi:hypothetical protein